MVLLVSPNGSDVRSVSSRHPCPSVCLPLTSPHIHTLLCAYHTHHQASTLFVPTTVTTTHATYHSHHHTYNPLLSPPQMQPTTVTTTYTTSHSHHHTYNLPLSPPTTLTTTHTTYHTLTTTDTTDLESTRRTDQDGDTRRQSRMIAGWGSATVMG